MSPIDLVWFEEKGSDKLVDKWLAIGQKYIANNEKPPHHFIEFEDHNYALVVSNERYLLQTPQDFSLLVAPLCG